MLLKILEREKIDYQLPVFTLDVNQIGLKNPSEWPSTMNGLAQLEWNYFEGRNVEMCVTPETPFEITRGVDVNSLGFIAYKRFQKSQLFKSRPPGLTLSLQEQDANELWLGIRNIVWPSVTDQQLTARQRADVSQLFFHTVTGSTVSNEAFLTIDSNFHNYTDEIKEQVGVTILTPNQAWQEYESKFNLYKPSDAEILVLWQEQQNHLNQLHHEANPDFSTST